MRDSKAATALPRRPQAADGPARGSPYDKDVILWSEEQARLLRARRFSELDLEHLADEIEDVGRSEKRELANRMAVSLAHLIKWKSRPDNRTNSWRATINDQRRRIALAIKETPSLKAVMRVADWQEGVWLDARSQARKEMGLRATICRRCVRGRWIRRLIGSFGRSRARSGICEFDGVHICKSKRWPWAFSGVGSTVEPRRPPSAQTYFAVLALLFAKQSPLFPKKPNIRKPHCIDMLGGGQRS